MTPFRKSHTRLTILALGASLAAVTVAGAATGAPETAAQVAKKPVVPPKPARLADGHPNWTGFWVPVGGLLENDIGLGGTPAAPDGKPLPPPPKPFGDYPAIKSPYKEQLDAFTDKLIKTGEVADPVAECFPPGMPRMMSMVYGMELLQTPGQVSIMSEWQAEARRIWLDHTAHPPADELDPSYGGDSIGHWEGDTLVVDTVGIRNDVPINYTGLMHGDKLHIVERIHSPSPGLLLDDFTITDPEVFDGPWHHTEAYHYRSDLHLEEYVCLDNNRNVGKNGEATFNK